jgi:hypothetical protein
VAFRCPHKNNALGQLDVVGTPLISALGRQRQVDLDESEASLVYRVNPGQPGLHREKPYFKHRKKKKKKKEKEKGKNKAPFRAGECSSVSKRLTQNSQSPGLDPQHRIKWARWDSMRV